MQTMQIMQNVQIYAGTINHANHAKRSNRAGYRNHANHANHAEGPRLQHLVGRHHPHLLVKVVVCGHVVSFRWVGGWAALSVTLRLAGAGAPAKAGAHTNRSAGRMYPLALS